MTAKEGGQIRSNVLLTIFQEETKTNGRGKILSPGTGGSLTKAGTEAEKGAERRGDGAVGAGARCGRRHGPRRVQDPGGPAEAERGTPRRLPDAQVHVRWAEGGERLPGPHGRAPARAQRARDPRSEPGRGGGWAAPGTGRLWSRVARPLLFLSQNSVGTSDGWPLGLPIPSLDFAIYHPGGCPSTWGGCRVGAPKPPRPYRDSAARFSPALHSGRFPTKLGTGSIGSFLPAAVACT